MSQDLMGGYAAYTSPNAALRDMAVSGAANEEASLLSVSVAISLLSIVTRDMSATID
jgi:hypothetical protein